jgi:cbb3-type cytochrome oxidase maturation protein
VDILFFLIPIALGLGLGAVAAFRWAVRDGQFDDLDTPPLRVLTDDVPPTPARGEVGR